MNTEQLLGAWLMFGAGVAAAGVGLIGVALVRVCMDARVVGGRRGGRGRSACGLDGSCRRGDGSPRRVYREEVVQQFLAGMITLDDLRGFYEGETK